MKIDKNHPCQVYRCYDKRGKLLYVGASFCAPLRATQHRNTSPWLKHVRKILVSHYPTRYDALDAEWNAIWNERPRFNKSGKRMWRRT